jgi:prophage maintenance system killer protein
MSILYYLDIGLMEKMCHPLAVTFLDKTNEPIPLFSTCQRSALDACLNLPKATFDGKELYPDLVSKAIILYYSLIKNHPFINGNKRIATTSLIVFFYK